MALKKVVILGVSTYLFRALTTKLTMQGHRKRWATSRGCSRTSWL